MFWRSKDGKRGNVAADMAKVAAAIAFLSIVSAQWLSTTVATYEDKDKLARLAGNASRDKPDPVTTGSLAQRADVVRIDPCTGERRH